MIGLLLKSRPILLNCLLSLRMKRLRLLHGFAARTVRRRRTGRRHGGNRRGLGIRRIGDQGRRIGRRIGLRMGNLGRIGGGIVDGGVGVESASSLPFG